MRVPIPSRKKTARARELRKEATKAEQEAWRLLRNRQILGLKFKRQKVLHGFIADFYSAEHGLVLEIDGSIHDQGHQIQADQERAAALAGKRLLLIRLRNEEVDRETLTEKIAQALGKDP